MTRVVKVVAISDTHGKLPEKIPGGDVFVHAGDLTGLGKRDAVLRALDAVAELPHEHKVLIAGNHDFWAEEDPAGMSRACGERYIYYLDRDSVHVAGLTFWGSAWTPKFYDWAFMYSRGSAARAHWADLPEGLDVLVTHGPPFGMGDRAVGRSVGCLQLLEKLESMRRPPRLHVFGHIHDDRGTFRLGDEHPTTFANVASDYGRHRAQVFHMEVSER